MVIVDFVEKMKRKYNSWLFQKYGFERGTFFENIPVIYKTNPLFSPSLYSMEEGKKISEWFIEGMNDYDKQTKGDIFRMFIQNTFEIDGVEFWYEAKVFEEPSAIGINKGRISKLYIVEGSKYDASMEFAIYDRCWLVKPTKDIHRKALKYIINLYK